jgi:hypothetical protein
VNGIVSMTFALSNSPSGIPSAEKLNLKFLVG